MKGRSLSFDSPKAEVGEIDTRAPFASVKAAVSLFGEVAFSGRKGKPSTPSKTSTSVYSPTLEVVLGLRTTLTLSNIAMNSPSTTSKLSTPEVVFWFKIHINLLKYIHMILSTSPLKHILASSNISIWYYQPNFWSPSLQAKNLLWKNSTMSNFTATRVICKVGLINVYAEN